MLRSRRSRIPHRAVQRAVPWQFVKVPSARDNPSAPSPFFSAPLREIPAAQLRNLLCGLCPSAVSARTPLDAEMSRPQRSRIPARAKGPSGQDVAQDRDQACPLGTLASWREQTSEGRSRGRHNTSASPALLARLCAPQRSCAASRVPCARTASLRRAAPSCRRRRIGGSCAGSCHLLRACLR